MAIESGKGQGQSSGTRPADTITLLQNVNLLVELKRTNAVSFKLNMLRPNQLEGLIAFDKVIRRNVGIVFVSFLNEERGIDSAYSFRLIDALKFMKTRGRLHIKLEEFTGGPNVVPSLRLSQLPGPNRLYDLSEVNDYYSGYRK